MHAPTTIKKNYIPVWSAKHSKTRSLTDAAQNAMAPLIASSNVLYDQFYLNVDQTDATCFHYPAKTDDEVIIPGQCDETIPVVSNFNAEDVSNLVTLEKLVPTSFI